MQTLNLSLLAGSSYRVYNYEIAKKIGVDEAILLSDIISKYLYFEERNMLIKDGYFFSTSADIYSTTALSRHMQNKCLSNLSEYLETKVMGIPGKKHFKLKQAINGLLVTPEVPNNGLNSSSEESVQQEVKKAYNKKLKTGHLYNSINNNINKPLTETSSVDILSTWNQTIGLADMKTSTRRDIRLVAFYFKWKKIDFPSQAVFNKELKRCLATAKYLKDFDDDSITTAFSYCQENYPDWGIEAVLKVILKNINK